MVQLTVNGRAVEVPAGATLLEATRQAGVHVPTLCYHPRLPAQAVCRMCLVEVQGLAQPQPACHTPAQHGQVVLYRRPLEHRARTRKGLRILVFRTLVEQLHALTEIPLEELDPEGWATDDDWE